MNGICNSTRCCAYSSRYKNIEPRGSRMSVICRSKTFTLTLHFIIFNAHSVQLGISYE